LFIAISEAAILVALPVKLFEDEAGKDRRNLLKLLISRYTREAVITTSETME